MAIIGSQNDDRTSACRSFNSNYQPCSQSRKISIGVMVDSLAKSRPKPTKEHQPPEPSNRKPLKELNTGDLSGRGQAKANSKGNLVYQKHITSPWVSPKNTHSRKPTSEDVNTEKPTNDSQAGGSEFRKSYVPNSANQKSLFQSENDNIKEVDRVYSRRERNSQGEKERTKELPSATAQEVFVSEKEVAKDKATGPEDRRQVLKMKLWEILGANSSPNKKAFETPEVGVNDFTPEPDENQKHEAVGKPKQNSDTIESDSQSPDRTMKRAVTRSLARKKVASKAPTTKTKNVRKPASAKKGLEKNVFSFNEGQFKKVSDTFAGGSPKSDGKDQGRKGSKTEARKINFHEDSNAGEALMKGTKKTSSTGISMRSRQNSPPKNHSEFDDPENGNKENEDSLLPGNKSGGKGTKGGASRFRFSDKFNSDDVQPEINISETIRGAKKSSLTGNRMTSNQNIPPLNNSTSVSAGNEYQEKGSSLLSGTKRGRNGSKVEGDRISFLRNNSKEVQPEEHSNGTTKSTKRASTDEKRTNSYRSTPPESASKHVDAKSKVQEKDTSAITAKKKFAKLSSLRTSHHWFQQEGYGTSPLKNTLDPQADLQSPTFEFKTPAGDFSPGSLPKAHHGEDDQSPGNYSFNTPLSYKRNSLTPAVGTGTDNDSENAEDSPLMKSGSKKAEEDAEDEAYRSSPEKMDSESSKEVWAPEEMSPDIGISRNPDFVLHPKKRLRSEENFKFQRFSPNLDSPEVMEESDGSPEMPENIEGDGLANAISLLAMALQRVQSKIKSVTSKKSTEVLMSVAEEVHLKLQNAESQFEKDVGKLTSLNKSNRKHMETEFEEQQEQLKVIYQKFKEDISQHIQQHRSKVEGLQEQEKELRLFMEKRKASQREVLKQLDESIQAQLSDAETRIAAVHKAGKEKMVHLKQALGPFLKEGLLG